MNNTEEQKVVVYLDYATIPSLHYFLDFVDNYQDTETIRFFGLERFVIPNSIIQYYPKDKIHFFPIKEHNTEELNTALLSLVQQSHKKIYLELHLNLCHSLKMLVPLLSIYFEENEKFSHLKIYFYDDGSEGIVLLYELSKKDNLAEIIDEQKQKLFEVLEGKTVFQIIENVFRYLWSNVFDCQYNLLNTHYLQKDELSCLAKEIKNVNKIDLTRYHHFNSEQKSLFLQILGLPTNIEDVFSTLSKKIFLFIGTTLFNLSEHNYNVLETLHINAIREFTLPEGKYFKSKKDVVFYYKGHPDAKKLNKKILDKFGHLLPIPDFISLDILFLLGFKPNIIAGFSSTAYFNVDAEQIGDIIFLANSERTLDELNKEDDIQDFELIQLMLKNVFIELGYVSAEQCHHYDEFNKLVQEKDC